MKKETTTKKSKQLVSELQRKTLRKWNIRLGLLLAAEAVVIIVVGGAQTVPITAQYLATDQLASQASGHEVLAPAIRHLVDVQLSWVVAKFLLLFAAVYLLAATVFRARYEAWLERGVNKLRWVGAGFGGGTIAVAIAMLSGYSELGMLVLIFTSVVAGCLAALGVELIGPNRRLRKLLAAVALIAVLPAVAVSIATAGRVALFDGSLPTFVYYVYASIALLLTAGLLACYFRIKQRGKWADTVYTEQMFMFLGFLTASIVAWQIFAGALQA